MIGHRCENCMWWDNKHRSVAFIPTMSGKEQPGFCRKHKPGSVVVDRHYFGVQPVMDAGEFCGEFREDS